VRLGAEWAPSAAQVILSGLDVEACRALARSIERKAGCLHQLRAFVMKAGLQDAVVVEAGPTVQLVEYPRFSAGGLSPAADAPIC